ncbi:histidine phosphatase superfamily [Yarrowia lipolytica]|jgi:hypothetical protein|uniref:YALI0C06930p n=2 Tax=Yarrowia lipolytica TaxID=4952 RepID=Q6CCS5_YARLI|nr:YALI0C06930p [Yarrowia lipolytica CLIB122]RDW24605.1 histidine phosphatase superfamily [Yarrowia lipolytica]RDW32297.1 histidine phosphatase superfamily [Yarrowia lipolytica]RDW39055.1 histidine phosphatase superfamily [Yarrowia lipolytica]RDW48174.1 histidine phosphatase superfamily [Yarrowia lipolytica]RDW54965.1 histidine phosphatase superfamily [Yarrowia lipolytica]|eukprot:XP_501537.1 YALI0C06930p [Yarrowia lipolytica CLIB122]
MSKYRKLEDPSTSSIERDLGDVGSSHVTPGHPSVTFDMDEDDGYDELGDLGDPMNLPQVDQIPIPKLGARGSGSRRKLQSRRNKIVGLATAGVTVLLIVLYLLLPTISGEPRKSEQGAAALSEAQHTGAVYKNKFHMQENWGSLSPFFSDGVSFHGVTAREKGRLDHHGFPLVPEMGVCTLRQAHVLHRHGERYPTDGAADNMVAFADKLKSSINNQTDEMFAWVDHWNYLLERELLVPRGYSTEFAAGAQFWSSHGRHLFNEGSLLGKWSHDPIVIRATEQERIRDSAQAWSEGFFAKNNDLFTLSLQPEKDGENATLASYFSCKNAYNNPKSVSGKQKEAEWIDNYLNKASLRFQELIPGFENFTAHDAFQMQQLCAFETAAFGHSKFCEFFTETEWRGYEYASDLKFYYNDMFGSKTGVAQGAGWLSELVARLEGVLITTPAYGVDVGETSSNKTFPLDQPLYMDMSHDSVLLSVLTALNLDFLQESLTPDKIKVPRNVIISRLTPFGARITVEVFDCDAETEGVSSTYIRIVLNGRILPLSSLKQCPENADGVCEVGLFIDSVKSALAAIDYDKLCEGEL